MVKTHPSYKLHRHQNLLHYNVIGAKKCCSVPLLSLVSEDFAWCKRCTWTQDDASPFKCHSTWFKHNFNVTGLLSTPFQPQALPSLLLPCHFEAWWSRRERSWRSNSFTQFFFYKQAAAQSACTTHVPTLRHLVSRVLSFFGHPSLCLDHAALRHVCALLPDLGPFH